jgi:energy-coupling factor transporter ATP-binding protein EcfA2
MAKITKISFKNYRAFWGETNNEININGKNALIYGENGSGKSSLYQGLKDFFKAADVTWEIEKTPIHLKVETTNENDYEVKVVFDNDGENPVIYNGRTIENKIIEETYLLNSFLSYKELLKTHFIEQHEFNEKFFELLTQTLLNEHEIGDLTIGKTFDEIKRLQKSSKQDDKTKSKELLDNFNAQFPAELTKISEQCGKILEYFNQGLKIEFQPESVSFEKGNLKGNIGLKVDYIGKESVNHLEILNEARLSTLAISIYLAAIVTNPIVQKANYKIIFLDDIFVGLDMSNRLPLLEILQKFSLDGAKPFFEDFQIFITTYDRYWFEIAKKILGDSWTTIEMYAGNHDQDFEYPIVISPSDTYYQKAEKYANRKKTGNDKDIDYPAAGNYLRKEVEKLLKDLLYGKYRYKNGDDGQTLIREQLQDLWDSFALMMKDLELSLDKFSEFGLLSKTVFNPFSHDNLDKPIYRAEIDKAFAFVDELRKISKKELLKEGDKIYLNVSEESKAIRKYEIKAKDSVFVFQCDENKKTNALVVEFTSKKYSIEETETSFNKQNGNLAKLFDKAVHSVTAQSNASDGKDMLDEFFDNNGRKLQQMIDEI